MLRLAPLRRSLLRRALLAPRTSVAASTPSTQPLFIQKSRAIHWSSLPDNGERDYWKMAVDYAKFIAPLLLFITIYDYYEDHICDADPNRVKPSELVKESFAVVTQNELVASRLGAELFAYGDFNQFGDELDHDHVVDSSSLRDDCISHAVIEQDCGRDRIKATYTTTKIKYNIKGSKGRGVVFARVQDDQKNGQYVYLLVTFVETGEALEIIDNRDELTAPVWEENAAKAQAKST